MYYQFPSLFLFFSFSWGPQKTLMPTFHGLHPSWIYCVSTPSVMSFMLSSLACLVISCASRMPTPVPVLFVFFDCFLSICIISCLVFFVLLVVWSLSSVLYGLWFLCIIVSRLLIFPFIPLRMHVSMIRFLFSLILFLMFLFLALVLSLFSSCFSSLVGLFLPIVSSCWSSLLLCSFLS